MQLMQLAEIDPANAQRELAGEKGRTTLMPSRPPASSHCPFAGTTRWVNGAVIDWRSDCARLAVSGHCACGVVDYRAVRERFPLA
jgi:hypothetical protein